MFKNSPFFEVRIFLIMLMIVICIISNAGMLLLLQKHQEREEEHLLGNFSNTLSDTLIDKIEYLYEKASIKSNSILEVKVEGRNLVFHDENKKYLTYSIQKLQHRLNTTDLSVINYRIKINKKLLLSNKSNKSNYMLNKKLPIGKSYLEISTSIKSSHLKQINKLHNHIKIWCLTYTNTGMLLIASLASYFAYISNSKKFYAAIKKLDSIYQDKELEIKNLLWESEYSRKQDKRFLEMFMQESKRVFVESIVNKDVNSIENDRKILFRKDVEKEVKNSEIIKILKDRFDPSKLTLCFKRDVDCTTLGSQASYYQIMYSLIDYIFFLVKSRVENPKIEIELSQNNSIQFCFEGGSFETEESLNCSFSKYYKECSNPMVISPSEIFLALRKSGLGCKYYYDAKNYIVIGGDQEINNIIKFKNKSKTSDL